MRRWKIRRTATLSDEELENYLTYLDDKPNCEVKNVIFIGYNNKNERIYQIVFVKDEED